MEKKKQRIELIQHSAWHTESTQEMVAAINIIIIVDRPEINLLKILCNFIMPFGRRFLYFYMFIVYLVPSMDTNLTLFCLFLLNLHYKTSPSILHPKFS